MTWRRRIALFGPAVGLVGLQLLYSPPAVADVPIFILDALVGWILIVAGLVAWERRPAARTGPLLVFAGYLWYVGDFGGGPIAAVSVLSFAWHGYYDVILAYVALTFPTGRLFGLASRVVVGGLLAVYVARSVMRMLGAAPGFGYPGPDANPFNVIHSRTAVEWVDVHSLLVVAVLFVGVAVLAAARWLRATPARRRVITPIAFAAVAGFGVTAFFGFDEVLHNDTRIDLVPWNSPIWQIPTYLARSVVPLAFLFGALQLRAARAAVVDLAAQLDAPGARSALRDRLRRALGDPRLEVLYAQHDGTWVDDAGVAQPLPTASDVIAVTKLEASDGPVGAIIHDTALLEDPALVQTVATTTRLVLENEQFRADLTARLDEVRASRARIAEAGDAERRRIERDLHDGAQQGLVGLALTLRMVRSRLRPETDPQAVAELDIADRELRTVLEEVRELARGVHPAVLRQAGLRAALISLAGRSPIPVEVTTALEGAIPDSVEVATYFVVSEALTNVAKHAGAQSASVRAERVNGRLHVEIEDDGRGGAAAATGGGLRGLADRVEALGGALTVRSPTAGGTIVTADIPCPSA